MDEKKYFVEQIDKLIKYGRENGNMVSEKEVSEYFKEINLSNEQLQLVYNFLYDSKIGLNEPFDVEETLDEEDKDYLQMYIEELESIEKISDKKRFELIKKHVSTGEDLSSKIIESYLWDVIETAKLYAGGAVTIEDLIGEGNVALAFAVSDIPKDKTPEQIDAYITESVMAAMEEITYEDNNEKSKADTWAEDANEVLEKAKELAQTLGRNVKIDELCRFGDFEEDFIKNVINITGGIDIIEE
ncbi:MAG: hypothetical protein MJ126_06575 [Lachnospiraceae bacterium]|nr:hypothetical protein [Lachnospiraceae bacterium]